MVFRCLKCGYAKCLHHNSAVRTCHVGQTNPQFNFIANCWLFEDFSSHTKILKMVYLKTAILSQDPPVFQLPQDPREVGEEQREYELSL